MIVFDWETFWKEHPAKQLAINNVKWANLRPSKYDYEKAFKDIDGHLKITNKDHVLDIGCGTGELFPYLQKKTKYLSGVDFSQVMVDEARNRYPFADFSKAPMHFLPYTDETFDKIICNGVIQHIPFTLFEASIIEALRVLKKGGVLYMGDVLEKADEEAEVFLYPKDVWKYFKTVKFSTSSFEKRLVVLVTKSDQPIPSVFAPKPNLWGAT